MTLSLKQQILAQAAPDLAAVESALRENLNPLQDRVLAIASHLLFSGGKRLRPLLMIHAARICGYSREDVYGFATIFEYLHTATLLHDDVVDEAGLRRGKPVAHIRWSVPEVVLTGDFLLARALEIAASASLPRLITVMAHITRDMSQGEIDQLAWKGRLDLTEAQYRKIIERKTAVLIQGACRSGAILSAAPADVEEALASFGYHLGMAFQMADDLLDYTATSQESGKNPGADLREGKLTLPVIYSLGHAGDADRHWMEEIIANPETGAAHFLPLCRKLEELGGIAYTRDQAAGHVAQACQSLSGLPDSASRELLERIAAYALQRKG